MRQRYNRTASTIITFFGAVTNSLLALQVLAAWHAVKWEPESEWELSGDKWQLTGVKVLWGLLFLYFALNTLVCSVGLHGILKHKPSHVRFYRDYSIADFSFCAFFTAVATYGAFLGPARAGLCEELSHHPELMRDVLEMGLNLENCELWLERAVFAGLAFMLVIMVIRLHFLLAVSKYYSHLARHRTYHQRSASCSFTCVGGAPAGSVLASQAMQRIYVVPSLIVSDPENGVEMVYAQVPLHTLPKEVQDQATEAWLATSTSAPSLGQSTQPAPHRHHHRRHHSHGHRRRSSSSETTGRIKLDIGPEEGLLPVYVAEPESDLKA
ncbi:hypothetical protein HYPSUDRAFT_31651 [Hypholoma sublateritium FD-334 SS-4]|uniref:Uncharacterized protein n=1 Tax=Hypholoma sublateritium (strain FD-334 SS-4) TaxID=945553 RepID=A0A0D2MZZ3_HYPSF|nr:hypothetical protein HYPSUDRAFT_31651 [Hypholoma sublateritium FD-334 SS-4]